MSLSAPARPRRAAIPRSAAAGGRVAGRGRRPRVGFPLSHLLINCLLGAVLWAGIIALVAGGYSALRWALG